MNWQAWFSILTAALGAANPAIGGFVGLVANGVLNVVNAGAEDKALLTYWQGVCQKIVDENREPTAEEHQAALDFANAEHTKAQNS